MAITIKWAIRDEVENLSKIDKFYDELFDRREKQRILRHALEGKGPVDITQFPVSTFTEPKALQATLNLLRQINCEEAAETLVE